MPRGDGTGPNGQGPLTGRRMGYCAGFNAPGFISPGFGRRMGRGFGRGFRWRARITPHPIVQPQPAIQPQVIPIEQVPIQQIPVQQPIQPVTQITPEQEKQMLEQEREYIENDMQALEQEMQEIKKRLKEIK